MKKEKAERVVEIMKDLRDLKYDLNHWDKASFYKEGDNAHVYAGGGIVTGKQIGRAHV